MSRVLKAIAIPSGVSVSVSGQNIDVKGAKGALQHVVHDVVEVKQDGDTISFAPRATGKPAMALTGTTRAMISNLITGVTNGFEKKLQLIGVGYRAQAQGNVLNLTLGFSHPVNHQMPEGVSVETPSQTEIVVKGIDKQKVGQVAADIRGYRPPEPYKGKGVRYADEHVVRKEAKKK
ncbi:MAG: 50S ribosomal protein L6 [Gammaproteobacteria bacterium]|nr:50S ribosomal protein L6 [Gammaproteobacteria bacterium]